MKTKIRLTIFSLLFSIGLFAQPQSFNLSVCGHINTTLSIPFNNTVTMNVMNNGTVINTQTIVMTGPPVVCFQPVSIQANGFSIANYTLSLSIDSCQPIILNGTLSSNDSVDVVLNLCNSNCTATITNSSATTFPASLTATSSGPAPYTYSWSDFGGNILSTTGPVFFPNVNGTICCTITDSLGCSSQTCYSFTSAGSCSTTITAITPPNVPPNSVMGLQANTFNAIAPFNYSWYLNNQLLIDTTMTITVSQGGIYTVIVNDANGCISSDSIVMNLNGVSCSANISSISNPIGGITLTAMGNGTAPYFYFWSNGDSSQSIVSMQAGFYSVTIIDAVGCVSIASIIDTVSSNPCSATINYSSPLLGIPAMLVATGTGVAPLNYTWTLNGTPQSSNGSTINPSGIGTYCVLITDANGCTSQACITSNSGLNCQTIIVDSVVWNAHILYAYSSSVGPFTYSWSINGIPISSNNQSSIYAQQSGLYSVTITDAQGCVSTDLLYVNLPGCLPVTSIGLTFNGVTSITAGSTGIPPFIYSWTLNGLPFSNQQTITTTINGTYCYMVTDSAGCVASYCYNNTVNPQGSCSAYFSYIIDSLFLPFGNSVLIDFTSYPNGTPPFTYQWNFSDGTMSNLANPQHMFYTSANMWNWADLTITDANGCISNYSNSVILPIFAQNCSAYFTSSSAYNPASVGEVNFQNQSLAMDSSTTYFWNFGDGTSSTLENPTHIYTVSGTYYITLSISNGNCNSTFAMNNYIDLNWWNSNPYSGNCSAGYVILNATGIPGLAYIIDVSQVNNPFYTWNTSNGFMSNNPTPFFNLTGLATYTLCVTVTDTINGCNDTFCDSLSIDSLGNVGRNPIQTFSNSNASVGIAVIFSPKATSPTSINNVSLDSSISLIPNPANNLITINFKNTVKDNLVANIIDIAGNLVLEQMLIGEVNRIDVSNLSNGTYFVKINSNKNTKTLKLIINH